jgi:hypothetical protein
LPQGLGKRGATNALKAQVRENSTNSKLQIAYQ